MTVAQAGLDMFLENPSAYFDYSGTRMLTPPRAEMDALQLAGVRKRFAQLRNRIPMLERLTMRARSSFRSCRSQSISRQGWRSARRTWYPSMISRTFARLSMPTRKRWVFSRSR